MVSLATQYLTKNVRKILETLKPFQNQNKVRSAGAQVSGYKLASRVDTRRRILNGGLRVIFNTSNLQLFFDEDLTDLGK